MPASVLEDEDAGESSTDPDFGDGGHRRSETLSRRDNSVKLNQDVTQGHVFQAFMGAVIGLNTLAMAAETDHPGWPIWPVLDNSFLCIFLAELVLRVGKRGVIGFLTSKKERVWNILDTVIVLLGVVDLWLAPLLVYAAKVFRAWGEDGQVEEVSSGSVVLRFLRLLRLLRLLRVFKMVRRLAAFLEAITMMLGPFFLVIFVLFGFNLFVSIGMTQLLGHNEDPENADEVSTFFSDVRTSFFSLFQVITMDNWFVIAKPVIEMDGWWSLFFVLFITFCSWTMISILTAVASDNVISATTGKQEKERLERERKTKEFYRLLKAMFETSDEDGNGLLDKPEFEAMLETEQLNELLATMEIPVTREEFFQMWDTLDVAGTGVVTITEFVDGLAYLQEDEIQIRHIASLDFSIRRLSSDLERRLHGLTVRIQEWRAQKRVLLEVLQQEEEVSQQQSFALHCWLQWAVKTDPGSFPPDLQDLAFREAEKRTPSRFNQSTPRRITVRT
mmetsp:Transcript_92700/g.276461  ORF Transcript_92700/g.276461 Transcript_92700/m.276461 type:complete len:502 (+) Transcript_92700:111-1616(+)